MSRPHRLSRQGCRATRASSSPIARAGRAVGQQPFDPHLLSLEAKLVEPGRLGEQRGLVGEIGEGRPAPQGQGVVERARPRCPGPRAGPSCASLMRASNRVASSSDAIERAGGSRARGSGSARAEGLPEVRDIGLDDVPRRLRRLVAPDLVDQGLGGHELVRAHEEMGQDRALLRPAERDGPVSRVHLERPEDAELQLAPARPTPVTGCRGAKARMCSATSAPRLTRRPRAPDRRGP